jgi:hypothetical protein
MMNEMKRRVFLAFLVAVLLLAGVIAAFRSACPTHFLFDDRFVLGSTQEQIVEKYGAFNSVMQNENGDLVRGAYMIHDDTPEWIMSYDDSLWYDVYFENGVAVEVRLREGYIGG